MSPARGCYYDIIAAVYSKTMPEKVCVAPTPMECRRKLPVGVMQLPEEEETDAVSFRLKGR